MTAHIINVSKYIVSCDSRGEWVDDSGVVIGLLCHMMAARSGLKLGDWRELEVAHLHEQQKLTRLL